MLYNIYIYGDTINLQHYPPHISLDKLEIWLGEVKFSSSLEEPQHVTLRMSNHTRGKITALWIQGLLPLIL